MPLKRLRVVLQEPSNSMPIHFSSILFKESWYRRATLDRVVASLDFFLQRFTSSKIMEAKNHSMYPACSRDLFFLQAGILVMHPLGLNLELLLRFGCDISKLSSEIQSP